MSTLEERLAAIERRLEALESRQAAESAPAPTPEQTWRAYERLRETPAAQPGSPRHFPVTQILGWTGASAIVLAMAYLIRLGLESGWLTPARQLALALLAAGGLIAGGLRLRAEDRAYAGLLPAGGLVILYLVIYGAHLLYGFIDARTAAVLVILTSLATLWLGRLFASELYALFAVIGSYSAPFLLPASYASVTDLVIYYSAWSATFCAYSIWTGSRRPYLLAAYLALLGFNQLWRELAPAQWQAALVFQLAHLAIFLAGTTVYSLRHKSPLGTAEALAHLPLLLIFYALQYELLASHVPDAAPWIALGSAALVAMAAGVATRLGLPSRAGTLLAGTYAALVVFHAGYVELLPERFAPWVGALTLPLAVVITLAGDSKRLWGIAQPMRVLLAVVFLLNYLRVTLSWEAEGDWLALLYGIELYIGYALVRHRPEIKDLGVAALVLGHVAVLAGAMQLLDDRFLVSLAWGVTGLAALGLAFRLRDPLLGKSSLLVFAASAVKVFVFDLSGAAPLARIGSLLVLGATLYAGGWMYRRIQAMEVTAGARSG
ncbi:MAG: DUF2339 domain-containing protein [Steroidobacteraceae bacterium]